MKTYFIEYLINITQSNSYKELEVIQSLWSGYGKISRIQLKDSIWDTVVVKHIDLVGSNNHPRGWNTNFSHQRKVKSYEIEIYWYKHWSLLCDEDCRIPKYIGSYLENNQQWIILEDLNKEFPIRKQKLSLNEVRVCLAWLANFHAVFLDQTPNGLWEIGTYWHLDTRPEEFQKISNPKLKEKATTIDTILNNCNYKTIVHGDAKLANFCFSKDGTKVAAVDFQYVGGGCGIKDVAYFLGSCLSSEDCEFFEKDLLDYYFNVLDLALKKSNKEINYSDLEMEWRSMYSYAHTDFTRFLMGWMPTHQKLNNYSLGIMNKVLKEL